ncbi:MAG: tol-pal system-associated acyl-CoA thioesterase [Gammaproteobacteria bacterium]|nr:tol-pal system-associated acyl-CoA thioesterase [Gammaproteobacteria bacterium]
MSEFIWPVRVYYEDTDNGGVVYYANYLKFMERARTEWLRSFGIEQDQLIAHEQVIFAVRSVKLDYLKPAKFNDLLQVSAQIIKCGGASIIFEQGISRDGEILCQAEIKIASLDAITLMPRPIPDVVKTILVEEKE